MIVDTKDGKTMYIIFKREIKTFDTSCIKVGDSIIIEHYENKRSERDYFISTTNYKATVTTRTNINEILTYKQPYFLQDFIIEIQLRLYDTKVA